MRVILKQVQNYNRHSTPGISACLESGWNRQNVLKWELFDINFLFFFKLYLNFCETSTNFNAGADIGIWPISILKFMMSEHPNDL